MYVILKIKYSKYQKDVSKAKTFKFSNLKLIFYDVKLTDILQYKSLTNILQLS